MAHRIKRNNYHPQGTVPSSFSRPHTLHCCPLFCPAALGGGQSRCPGPPLYCPGLSWAGPHWAVLGHIGLCWATQGSTGPHWAVLDSPVLCWDTLGCAGPHGLYWAALGCAGHAAHAGRQPYVSYLECDGAGPGPDSGRGSAGVSEALAARHTAPGSPRHVGRSEQA